MRWLTLTPAELEIAQTQYGLLTSKVGYHIPPRSEHGIFLLVKEFRALMTALEHINCSCPLPARLEGRRDKMRLRRCGLHHVSPILQTLICHGFLFLTDFHRSYLNI